MSRSSVFTAIFLVALLSLAFSGCKNAEMIATELQAQTDVERIAEVHIERVATMRGEQVVKTLDTWSKSLADIDLSVKRIADRLSSHPEEKLAVNPYLLELKQRLEVILGRALTLSLLVPQWQKAEAETLVREISTSLSNIQRGYMILFPNEPRLRGSLSIALNIDSGLFDTYENCVEQFDNLKGQIGDWFCGHGGRFYCGHQMNLECVRSKISLFGSDGCSEWRRRDRGVIQVTAAWVKNISECTTKTAILKR